MKLVRINKGLLIAVAPILILGFSATAISQTACVEQGALAWDNWTKTNAGGSGLPGGIANKDYIRCKACHGWDRMGTDGGYARRSRKETRPNAGAGDGDSTNRTISTLMGGHETITDAMILHDGIGRDYADGTASWVALDGTHSSANKAAHSTGYTLGNQHPDFSAAGPNGSDLVPTSTQIDCLTKFINFAAGDPSAYFDNINPAMNPVLYTIRADASAAAGETYYNTSCMGCHGDPATDHQGANQGHPEGGILAMLEGDGKFSEFAHKTRWGIPDTIMSRASMGSPSAKNIADVMKYLQDLGGTGFSMTAGLNGTWVNTGLTTPGVTDQNGEGFNFEIIDNLSGGLTFLAFFYTYDTAGNQMFMIAQGPVDGNSADVNVVYTTDGFWGDGANSAHQVVDWGTGTFTASSCGSMHMQLSPNAAEVTNGFTDREYDLIRLTTPVTACP